MTGSSEARFCTSCGTALAGRFCASCGTAAGTVSAPAPRDGWSGLTGELLSQERRLGILGTVLSFLHRPVDTIIRLTDNPAYRGHWKFLTAMVGTQLTLVHVLLPHLYARLFNLPDTANAGAVVTNEIVQYVGMVILTPIQFYLCRALGSVRRAPMEYVKLCVLSVSFCALLSTLVALLFTGIAMAVFKFGIALDLANVWQGLAILVSLAILAFVAASHRRFWGMSWPIAVGVTLAAAALSWLVVYPGLTHIVEQGNVAGVLGSLLG
ncbi:hypothetical protein DLM45_08680 [Hyphomicrobium methylovorum]|uniref:zinc ribbon domain-containing protein n=1 Tax=Hyphomicrobium methylovorum TaxID=84 RepID=UPI0015E7E262|nr:zinc ribbon domain-containing protein [Hyphomicrobium methylovorum]MBA2126297.1 hypothetical protein [Hyphomicrobium methylovorum]